MSRERFGSNYLVFRNPNEYIILVLPVLVGIIVNVFTGKFQEIDGVSNIPIGNLHLVAIDNYLTAFKISAAVLLAFFLSYRWSTIQTNGEFAFWLTLGVNQRSFLIKTINKFTLSLLFSEVLGLFIVFYLNSFVPKPDILFQLSVAIFANIFFIVVLGFFLSTLFLIPEVSSILFLGILGLNFGFNTDQKSILFAIFQPDLSYRTENFGFSVIISLALSIILLLSLMRTYLKRDVEM